MLFSSMTFMWIFLPLLLLLYWLAPCRCKNAVLLLASIIFYAWGEPKYILLILISVTVNYFFGRVLEAGGRRRRWLLLLCVAVNLGILGYFKYFHFFGAVLNSLAGKRVVSIREIALPLGISFYTFQALSYVIDVYRGVTGAQRNFRTLVLYIMLFPQLVAGPIVKYKDVEKQLTERTVTDRGAACGVRRFLYGLSKKVLLSNTLALYADMIMDMEAERLGTGAAWLGAVIYTLQIYYDFSGYSDMAIGLGKMLGFDFPENFNFPYMASSIRDFWRRWHISLSTWFRDYVYIPLGGSRRGLGRTCVNLMIVFSLTGLWHGAGFNFILWGVYYGVFLILERLAPQRTSAEKTAWKRGVKVLGHLYTMLVVVTGWVLFRQESLSGAAAYLSRMFVPHTGDYGLTDFLGTKILSVLVSGILLCGPAQKVLKKWRTGFPREEGVGTGEALLLGVLLFLSIVLLVSGTYNPFIYFRF